MTNFINPDTPKVMAEQRYNDMRQASENARLLKNSSTESRSGRRSSPRRPGISFVRKLAFSLLIAFIAVLIAATIAIAAGGGGGVGGGSHLLM